MKKLFVILIFPMIFTVCKNDNNKAILKEKLSNEKIFNLSEHYSKFKLHDVNFFEIKSSKKQEELIKLDSVSWKKIWQDSLEFSHFDPCYFYSTFKDSSKITILQEKEDWNSTVIWYLIYDKNGKLKLKEALAIEGLDGGDYWNTTAKFIKENQWTSTTISSSTDFDTHKTIDDDSTVTKYTILPNFLVKSDSIFK